MLRNPLIIATLLGLLVNAAGLRLPDFLSSTMGRLGAASIALGLMAVGAGLRISGGQGNQAFRIWMLSVKLLMLPAVALGVGLLLGLSHLQLVIVVTFAALPSASSAYIPCGPDGWQRRPGGLADLCRHGPSRPRPWPLWLMLVARLVATPG